MKTWPSIPMKILYCVIVAASLIACSVTEALIDVALRPGSPLCREGEDESGLGLPQCVPVATATASFTPTATVTSTPTPTIIPSPTATSSPTATPMPSALPTDSTEPRVGDFILGHSAGDRAIHAVRAGYSGGMAVVIVGGIDGLQTETSDLVDALASWYTSDLMRIPPGLAFYFIARINPDGAARGSRFNDHRVDLNRNWDTSDWVPDPPVPSFPGGLSGAGGPHPFSESETQALRDLILVLKDDCQEVLFVVLHSSVSRPTGESYPGYISAGEHEASIILAQGVSLMLGYAYKPMWEDYEVPGEVIHWTAEQGLPSVDIVWPTGSPPEVSLLTRLIDLVAR